MDIFLVLLVLVVVVIVLKTFVFSTKSTKLFRRVWSSHKTGIYQELPSTYDNLFEKYDIIFSNEVEIPSANLANLLEEASVFDSTHPTNLGIRITPIIIEEVRRRASEKGIELDFEAAIAVTLSNRPSG